MLNLIGVNQKLELLKPGDFVGDAVRTQRMEVRRVYSRESYVVEEIHTMQAHYQERHR